MLLLTFISFVTKASKLNVNSVIILDKVNGNDITMSTKRLKISVLFLLILFSLPAAPLHQSIRQHGIKCVSLVFDDNYSAAHKEADILIKKFPKSPSGYFMKAAVYHHEMMDLGSKKYSSQFYAICDKGVKLGQSVQPGDAGEWDRFFMAGTLGIRGAYERSRNRLVTSLKLGWRAIDIFHPLKDSGNIDALYGVAVYDYWVGANLKLLWWMEDAKDERPRALKDLLKISSNGIFTQEVVLYDLLEVYVSEKNYQQVKNIAERIISRHPENTVASEYLFSAQIKLKKYEAAQKNLIQREINLKKRNAPDARFTQLKKDWKDLSKQAGIKRS